MHRHTKKVLRLTSSISLIGLGIVGLLIPIIPGIPIILAGLYLLNPKKFKKGFHKAMSKFKRK